jgi:hypothetical protein
MADSTVGEKMALGIESSAVFCIGSIANAESKPIYGVSIPRSVAPLEPQVVLADAADLASAGTPRRNCKSQKTMRWAFLGAASARRFIWSLTQPGTSWPSGSALAKGMIHEASSRRCDASICRGVAADLGGLIRWRATADIAIRQSDAGYESIESER